MSSHPYQRQPSYTRWRRAVADLAPGEFDPVTNAPFRIGENGPVVSAGSCFAQHIGRFLRGWNCDFLVTEPGHAIATPAALAATSYGIYSARYGNIYTARQLLQLFERAYDLFRPAEDMWRENDGSILDPFRPTIQPGGFNSEREFRLDRESHFRAVRDAFERLEVFIFTLGLTEAWRSRKDGAVFPVCPGVSGGEYSDAAHEFVNFDTDEVVADMTAFVRNLRKVNRSANVILTVSPVPLMATAESRHVAASTVYSKSVLRVACDKLERALDRVVYFPSYEIVAGGFTGRDYYASDRRSVTEEGVAHVMRVFARHFLRPQQFATAQLNAQAVPPSVKSDDAALLENVKAIVRVHCDEEALDLIETQSLGTPPRRAAL